MLHGCCVQLFADSRKHELARLPVVAEHPNLDEFVSQQVDIDLVQHGCGQSFPADTYDRIEMVCLGAQRTPLRGC